MAVSDQRREEIDGSWSRIHGYLLALAAEIEAATPSTERWVTPPHRFSLVDSPYGMSYTSAQVDTTGKGDDTMTVKTMKSEEARLSWRDVLDTAHTGGAVVVERYEKPVAVVISYRRWEQMQAEHLELLKRWAADADRDGTWVSWEEAKAGLAEPEAEPA